MLTFDTIKFKFPTQLLSNIIYSEFTEFKDKKDTDKKVYYLSNPAPGIISVKISVTETAIEFSAKTLKGDYPKLVSIDTIEAVLFALEAALPCTFDVHEVLSLSYGLKGHQTADLTLKQPFADYAVPLAQLHVNRAYELKPYKDETVTFIQKALKNPEYFKIYDKEKEYVRSANAAYRETLSKDEKEAVSAYFKGKIRVETELNGKKKLQQYFPDIPKEIKLIDMLRSTSNPLAKQFTEITKQLYVTISTQTETKSISFADSLDFKEMPLFSHLAALDFDLAKLDRLMKINNVPKRTAATKRKEYAAMLAKYKAHESDSSTFESLHELKEAICNPVSNNYSSLVPNSALTVKAKENIFESISKENNNHSSLVPISAPIEIPEAVRLADERFAKELAALPELEADFLSF